MKSSLLRDLKKITNGKEGKVDAISLSPKHYLEYRGYTMEHSLGPPSDELFYRGIPVVLNDKIHSHLKSPQALIKTTSTPV